MSQQVEMVALSDIFSDDGFNCRGRFAPHTVFELAKNIAEHGLIQPIVLQPWNQGGKKYRIVCGHRRFLAFRLNEDGYIPALIRDDLSEDDAHLLNLTENLRREDLNLLQEARAIKRFLEQGWSQERIAIKLSVNTQWVRVRRKLLDLEPEIQERAAAGMLTQYQIMDISKMPTRQDRMDAVRKAVEHKLTGERGSLNVKKGSKKRQEVFTKKPRTVEEIHAMQELIYTVMDGNNLTTRFAAWAAGIISGREFHKDLQLECLRDGRDWQIPNVESPY